jgi:hypothetical protein
METPTSIERSAASRHAAMVSTFTAPSASPPVMIMGESGSGATAPGDKEP